MSIASEITRLQGVKSDILQSISDKGVTVPVGSALDDCPGLIASISGGGGGGMEIKEKITDMADDWEDITNDWSLCSGTSIFKRDSSGVVTPGSLADVSILLSRKLKLFFIQNKNNDIVYFVVNSIFSADSWKTLLEYHGTDFETTGKNYDNNPVRTDFIFPSDINRGESLFQEYGKDSGSIATRNGFGIIGFTGTKGITSNNGISFKHMIGNAYNSVILNGLVFFVTLTT